MVPNDESSGSGRDREDHNPYQGGGVIVTTTPSIEGRPITEYLGVVTGEAILGANIFNTDSADIRKREGELVEVVPASSVGDRRGCVAAH